jgi:N-acetylglutamate synthase-like GNAT family acetyltransferase
MASQADADAFRALNEEWIARWFRFEDKDRIALGDPQRTIVAAGGQVYLALHGATVVGTAALIRYPDAVYELSKMAVAPDTRGHGVGRKLLGYTVEQARALGARVVFLGSSTKLTSAVRLYESFGFRHVPRAELPEMKYDRADVFMKLALDPA